MEAAMRKNMTGMLAILLLTASMLAGCQARDDTNQNANRRAARNANDSGWSVNISRDEFERQKDRFAEEAKKLGHKVGTGGEDLWLWTKTRAALAYADDLRDVTINIAVDNNVVTLSGTVPSDAQKTKAEEIARSIEGVKIVKNDLTVSANKNAG
jgi:hyperosmotically inducible protein